MQIASETEENLKAQIKARDEKIREIQDKFDDLVPSLIQNEKMRQAIPEILESIEEEEATSSVRGLAGEWRKLIFFFIFLLIFFFCKFDLKASGDAVLVPVDHVVIKTKTSGILKEFFFKEGDFVSSGETLGTIDKENIIDEYTIKAKHAEAIYKKNKWLYDEGALSLRELNESEYLYNIALASFREVTQSALISSPVEGIVLGRNLHNYVGRYLEEGEEVCSVGDLGEMVLDVNIKEKYAQHIEIQQKVYIRFDSEPTKKYVGKVLGIGNKVEEVVNSSSLSNKVVIVRVHLENIPNNLKVNMNAKVKITYQRKTMAYRVYGLILKHLPL